MAHRSHQASSLQPPCRELFASSVAFLPARISLREGVPFPAAPFATPSPAPAAVCHRQSLQHQAGPPGFLLRPPLPAVSTPSTLRPESHKPSPPTEEDRIPRRAKGTPAPARHATRLTRLRPRANQRRPRPRSAPPVRSRLLYSGMGFP